MLTTDDNDPSLYTFTWTPTAIVESSIVFIATDDLGASSRYVPRIEFCQCQNGAECTLEGILDRNADVVDLNCACNTG